jgi:hypothetical protein
LLFIATWVALTFFVIHPYGWLTEEFGSYPFLLGVGIVLSLLGSGVLTRRIGRLPVGVAAVALASTALWQSVLFPLWIHGRFIPQRPFIYLLLPAATAIPIALAFFGGAKMIANRDETEQKLQDHRFVAVIAAVSQILGGLLVAGTWWWLMSRLQGFGYTHFDVWEMGPFLGATIVLISTGTWALMSRRSVVGRASGLAGTAVALAESPFVVPVFTYPASRLIVVGFALALAAAIVLFVSGAPRGADLP